MGTDALLPQHSDPKRPPWKQATAFSGVELYSDEIIDGFLVSQDKEAVILRIPNSEDRRIPQKRSAARPSSGVPSCPRPARKHP